MKPIHVVNIFLGAIVLFIIGRELYLRIMAKRSATTLTQEEFKEKMRFGQVIDLRESPEFNAGHILGARNMPYSSFKQSYNGLRKDKPVMLYDQKKSLSIRTANFLRKQGYQEIYLLKGGFEEWTGKTKKRNA